MKRGIIFIFTLFLTILLCYPHPRNEEKVFSGSNASGEAAIGTSITINGISLNDSKSSLHNKLGLPVKVYTKDDMSEQVEMHQFAAQNVAMSGGHVKYVTIPKEAKQLSVNHVSMRMDRAEIERQLGKPDWIAEDGIVYQRGESVLKVYIDPVTGQILSVELFHAADS